MHGFFRAGQTRLGAALLIGHLNRADGHVVPKRRSGGEPLVCLLFSGRPMIVTNEIQQCDAFVACWLPGTEGDGIAEVLYGDYDFRGKLTHTWPTSYGQEPINTGNMGDPVGSGGTPLFAYGYGLNLAGQQLPAGFYSTIP
jgi:beta-glucosidase